MSTRARIGTFNHSIHLTYDGYHDDAGVKLTEHYNTPDKVETLINNGNLAVLGDTIDQCINFSDHFNRDEDDSATTMDGVESYRAEFDRDKDGHSKTSTCYVYIYSEKLGWITNLESNSAAGGFVSVNEALDN